MSGTSHNRSFRTILDPNKVDLGITSILAKMVPLVLTKQKYRSGTTPMFITLYVKYDKKHHEIKPIRQFLNGLRAIHFTHGIRFITDLVWAATSDNADIFYTHDGNSRHISNYQWTIRILSNGYIECEAKTFNRSSNQVYIDNTSRDISDYISTISPPDDDDEDTYLYLEAVYDEIAYNKAITDIDNHFHILLINDELNGSVFYHAIPIVGMSLLDAQRKYSRSLRNLLDLNILHKHLVMKDDYSVMSNLTGVLISALRDNENLPIKLRDVGLSYSIAELLFSYYVCNINNPKELSLHEVLLLKTIDDETSDDYDTIKTYHASMSDMELGDIAE